MMLPSIVLIGLDRPKRLWIPIPAFLLWPVWLLGWVVWAVMWLLRIPGHRRLWLLLSLSGRLSGLRLDVKSSSGQRVQVRVI